MQKSSGVNDIGTEMFIKKPSSISPSPRIVGCPDIISRGMSFLGPDEFVIVIL
jgi:hypothetical protein